jgi:hypothetical protein
LNNSDAIFLSSFQASDSADKDLAIRSMLKSMLSDGLRKRFLTLLKSKNAREGSITVGTDTFYTTHGENPYPYPENDCNRRIFTTEDNNISL